MTPVVIGNATLYLGDCQDILPTLGKVDAVITDPPYGIGYARDSASSAGYRPDGSRVWGKAAAPIIGDDQDFDPTHLMRLAQKVVLWGASAYSERLPSNYGWMIWDKEIVGKWSGGDAETAWTNFLGSNRIFRNRWQGIQRAGDECPFVGGALVHPTQKPAALMRWCIERASHPELILDPYMGSGTTGVAAMQMGKLFIGIEIHPAYFDIACRRIEDAQRQEQMFSHAAPEPHVQMEIE